MSDDFSMQPETINKQLNYLMKCHLDHIKSESEKFEQRKKEMVEMNKKEQIEKKPQNRRQRRDELLLAKKKGINTDQKTSEVPMITIIKPQQAQIKLQQVQIKLTFFAENEKMKKILGQS